MLVFLLNAAVCFALLLFSPGRPLCLWAGLFALGMMMIQSLVFYRQSRRDDLTGLNNLRCLEDMERLYRRCPEVGVWYFDLDHLKQVNDNEGHTTGDRLLREFAAVLSAGTGRNAMAYRVGGDEFLLIMVKPEENTPPLPGLQKFSVSWGFASGDGSTLRGLIVRAEQEMYHKRRNGEFYGI